MIEQPTIEDRLAEADLGTYFRPCDAEAAGISYPQLRRLEGLGLVEREGWGLYRKTHADITRHHTLAAVCARAPQAVVCLLTALEVYDIGSQKPRQVWIAIPHKERVPTLDKERVPTLGRLPVRITRFSAAALTYGVEDTDFEGVPTRITTPARTVVDCFRFRTKIGLEPALEALHDALDDRKATPAQIWRAAEVCGARSLVEPALYARSY